MYIKFKNDCRVFAHGKEILFKIAKSSRRRGVLNYMRQRGKIGFVQHSGEFGDNL